MGGLAAVAFAEEVVEVDAVASVAAVALEFGSDSEIDWPHRLQGTS